MAPREPLRAGRENDYSNLGISGRRTGLVLPRGRVDANGIEEISGIFSSPRKPTPLRKSTHIDDDDHNEEEDEGVNQDYQTPTNNLSTRKSRPPRSASPRKSGISGTAKRGQVLDTLHPNGDKENRVPSPQSLKKPVTRAATPNSPIIPASAQRRLFDDITESYVNRRQSPRQIAALQRPREDDDSEINAVEEQTRSDDLSRPAPPDALTIDPRLIRRERSSTAGEDDSSTSEVADQPLHLVQDLEFEPLPPLYDDEDVDQTFEPEKRSSIRRKSPSVANSRKKRKSDTLEHENEADLASSPAAKRAKRISGESSKKQGKVREVQPEDVQQAKKTTTTTSKAVPKPKGTSKTPGSSQTGLSTKQQNELDQVVEKFKARPGQKKSLYILRREGRAENGTQTRSGRVSVKPLAYWRNERCVFGGSPSGNNIKEGARFPLNSIREIIRTQELSPAVSKKSRKKKQRKGKSKSKSQSPVEGDAISDAETTDDEERDDSDAEPWETEVGTIRGKVAIWDQEEQLLLDEEKEIDIAHAKAAIVTREVPDSSFKFAKLLSTGFFGSGIVELPAGGIKRPKNSKKMHMSFFVAKGRVSVTVGPLGGVENTFSIGCGGFWQVPRGNQYSIENLHDKAATIFFSQGCEAA